METTLVDGIRTSTKWKTTAGDKITFDEYELSEDGVKGNVLSFHVKDSLFQVPYYLAKA